jgi:ABC-2 type transport system permease protein
MKTLSIILKSLKEQARSIWLLLLLLSMGPFFVLIYSLITSSEDADYNLIVINWDDGAMEEGLDVNYGTRLMDFYRVTKEAIGSIPLVVEEGYDRKAAEEKVKNKHADALIIIGSNFSESLVNRKQGIDSVAPRVEFIGDLTNINYMVSAVWANEVILEYALLVTGGERPVIIEETALGSSGNVDEFNMVVPGILIIAIIMLMFTASIAFVAEVEHRTILRLQLSKMRTMEFLAGIGIVQLLIGVVAALLTLLTAIPLGFSHAGSYGSMVLILSLTSLSIIAFSLILAAVTRTAREILVVGNFPMFLFMFFTGAAFPIKSKALFTLAGYPVSLQGLMSPTHATTALNKILIMKMELGSVLPEIISILVLTVLYFVIGALMFRRRHLRSG